MGDSIDVPNLGAIGPASGFHNIFQSSDGAFRVGYDGVNAIVATGDRKVEFIAFADHALALVNSTLNYPAYYPLHPVHFQPPLLAVLMDLDGTSIHSETFWIRMIEKSIASMLTDESFRLEPADMPHVSGHSVSEHLEYGLRKYCPGGAIEDARRHYFRHVRFEMKEILDGRGCPDAFSPAPGLKDFLLKLKSHGIKIGLVTSGLYEKAWPEIVSGFETLGLGDPAGFYDAIITAGFPLGKGLVGTLGELAPKPHPWLYAEACCLGLSIPFEDRNSVVGIEDSGAGVCSVRIAGFPVIGLAGGNILESGTRLLCEHFVQELSDIPALLGLQ
jgi:beta-phosphoglucomutase